MSDDPSELRVAREEARRTLDRQAQTFDDIESKAISVMRFVVAVVGLLLSALSVAGAVAGPLRVATLLNDYTAVGFGALLAAAFLSGLTYTISAQYCGLDADALDRLLAEGGERRESRDFRRRLLAGYADWIRRNHEVNRRLALLSSTAILSVLVGIVALTFGALAALGHPPSTLLLGATGLAFLGAVYVAGVVQHLVHLLFGRGPAVPDLGDVVTGQQVFKGRERQDGER